MKTKQKILVGHSRSAFPSFKFRELSRTANEVCWYCENKNLGDLSLTEHLTKPQFPNVPIGKVTAEWRGTPALDLDSYYFDTKEDATTLVYKMLSMHQDAVSAVPIPVDIHDQLDRMLDDLRREEQDLRGVCATNRRSQEQIRRLAKSMGDNLGYDPDEPISKAEEAIQALDKFTLTGDKVPFFSEAKLYDALGKEDARTVLALIHNLKRIADPVKGE